MSEKHINRRKNADREEVERKFNDHLTLGSSRVKSFTKQSRGSEPNKGLYVLVD